MSIFFDDNLVVFGVKDRGDFQHLVDLVRGPIFEQRDRADELEQQMCSFLQNLLQAFVVVAFLDARKVAVRHCDDPPCPCRALP